MSSLFTARRKPKRIVRDESEAQADDVEEGMSKSYHLLLGFRHTL